MPYDSYDDWYDNGPGSVAFASRIRQSEIDFKQREFDRRRNLDNLKDIVLWYQETSQALTWIASQCAKYHGGFTKWEKAYKCIWDSFVAAERAVLDWRI